MEGITNVLVLEENELGFERVKRQVLAKYTDAMLVRAAGMKQLKHRSSWAIFDVALVNFGLPEYEALRVLLFVRERYSALPIVFVLDKQKKYSEADIAIIKQADGCVYREELFGQVGIIDDLVRLSRRRKKSEGVTIDRSLSIARTINLIRCGSDFEGRQEVLNLLVEIYPDLVGGRPVMGEDLSFGAGHRASQTDLHGNDPHVLVGAGAGAGGGF